MKPSLIRISHALKAEELIKRISNPFNLRIVCYHSVATNHPFLPRKLYISPENFIEQMYVIERHFQIISFDDIEEVKARRISFPIIVTFDDGLMDNYKVALPILKKLGIKATFYLNTLPLENEQVLWTHNLDILYRACDIKTLKKVLLKRGDTVDGTLALSKYVARNYGYEEILELLDHLNSLSGIKPDARKLYMGQNEIKDLLKSGMEVGCHGRTHCNLVKVDDVSNEILPAKESLESLCKREVKTFAYPFGDPDSFNQLLHTYLKKHFRHICTTVPKVNRDLGQQIYHRVCSYEMSSEKIILKLLLGI